LNSKYYFSIPFGCKITIYFELDNYILNIFILLFGLFKLILYICNRIQCKIQNTIGLITFLVILLKDDLNKKSRYYGRIYTVL
jgi:hypothetical protein